MIKYDQNEINKVQQKYNLDFIVLFGSFAKDRIKKTSDIDIAIKTKNCLNLKDYTEITHLFSQIFNLPFGKIGLVETSRLSPILMHQITKSGRLLSGDPLEFKKFRLYALKRYFDTKKFRDLTKRYIKQNLYA